MIWGVVLFFCLCVCVCVREREKERDREFCGIKSISIAPLTAEMLFHEIEGSVKVTSCRYCSRFRTLI